MMSGNFAHYKKVATEINGMKFQRFAKSFAKMIRKIVQMLRRKPERKVKVNLVEANGYTEDQLGKVKRAITILERVVNSQAFKDAILNFRRNGKGKRTFSYRKHMLARFKKYSNKKVYARIMEAKQRYGNVKGGCMDLYLNLVPGGDGITLGYGYPKDKEIFTYGEYLDRATDASLANHLMHEWCHKLGFDHAFHARQDKNRDFSVPYAVGNLVESLAEKVMN